MCTTGKWKTGILVIAMALACGSAKAQHWRRHYRPGRMVTVVVRPDVTFHVSNHFNQKERLAMALAYLETHKCLTIRQYAKITQLSMASAEAELDAFVMDKKKPIKLIIRGKKKVYCHHRYCFAVTPPITDTTLFNLASVECAAASEFAAYGNKG